MLSFSIYWLAECYPRPRTTLQLPESMNVLPLNFQARSSVRQMRLVQGETAWFKIDSAYSQKMTFRVPCWRRLSAENKKYDVDFSSECRGPILMLLRIPCAFFSREHLLL